MSLGQGILILEHFRTPANFQAGASGLTMPALHRGQIFLKWILGLWVSKEPAWLADYKNVKFLAFWCLMAEEFTKNCITYPFTGNTTFLAVFFKFLQVQSIALANNVHFCNQLSKLVLLIPMNPKFISKFFKPLLRGGSFFQWAGGSP